MTEKKKQQKFGMVAMLDAMGVRNATIKESLEFIDNVERIRKSIQGFMPSYFTGTKFPLNKVARAHYESHPPKIVTFGDTILILWELVSESDPEDYLVAMANIVSSAVVSGIQARVLLRGALTVGDYIDSDASEAIVLGPAIADAASWYEYAEWCGVVATPLCGQFVSHLHISLCSDPETHKFFDTAFVRYQVPIRSGDLDMWAIAWPYVVSRYKPVNEHASELSWFYSNMKNFSIPMGTEKKYAHTERFVTDVLSLHRI
jgi:hypothetical protein